MPHSVRVFHISGDQFTELESEPEAMPKAGYLWVASTRSAFESSLGEVQAFLQRWTGTPLFDLHVLDLVNPQLPSTFDYTSAYDLLVFRRLAAGVVEGKADDGAKPPAGSASGPPLVSADAVHSTSLAPASSTAPAQAGARGTIDLIDTSPVGFAVYDRVLLTVHPTDCQVRDFFAMRLEKQTGAAEGRSAVRMPTSPADLMLRMVNYMVDSYLELRRQLGKQLDELQAELFSARGRGGGWKRLLESRNALHLLEDTCEDQRAAVTEWLDALEEWPPESDENLSREREQLRVRSRDVLEHIERVLSHVRRLEASSETAVQMHFSEQSNRTNDIMRTLTTLTAIFLPLNLVTGFFGMNFEGLPLVHSARGFWVVFTVMLLLGIAMSVYFWRKRYLGHSR